MTHDQMKETMACQVCDKPPGLPLDKCHATMGKKNPLCNEYGKCRIAEQSEPQFNYAFSEVDKNIFLKACPGSGKTEVVGLKTAYEIKRWDKEVGGIAVLTFTNNAADVISERVSQFAGIEKIKYPHFIGTFDSWLHGYIAHPFGHFVTKYQGTNGDFSIRLIDANSNAKFMENKNFKTQPYRGKGAIKANEYYFDRKQKTYLYCRPKKGSLDCAGKDELKAAKHKFIEGGFANYQDIENICITILSKKGIIAERLALRFPLIIVDECQDLSWIQLQILKTLKDRDSKLHFVGDLNQAIYQFKKVDPKEVNSFVEREQFCKKKLSDNFRSCQPIVDLCQNIVKGDDEVISEADQKLDAPCLCLIYQDKNDLPKLADWFERVVIKKGLSVKDSTIVARGWSNVSKMRPSGNDAKINNYFKRLAMAIHLWNTGNIRAIEDSIKYMGQFFAEKFFSNYPANPRKHYCPECVDSAIQWRIFLGKILSKCIQNPTLIEFSKNESEWAKIVKSCFSGIAQDCSPFLADSLISGVKFPKFDGKFHATKGNAKTKVEALFSEDATTKSDVHITTIHSVKGQGFDAVMLVSAPSTKGTEEGYWTQWLKDGTSEAARLAYVASSRPKHLLVWALPKGNNGDMTELTELGFVPVYLDEDDA